jgi:hypothetical protein
MNFLLFENGQVLGGIAEMSNKINELEQSIDQLMSEADAEVKQSCIPEFT